MFRRFKYDVAFSFVQEDIEVVQQIAGEFKKVKGLRYYLYTEHEADGVGQHIFTITRKVYPKSRFVLIVTSKDFVNGFWARVEKVLMLSYIKKHVGRIIQLKLDSTPVDGLGGDIVSFRWRNDPERIAGVLVKKVMKQKSEERKRRIAAISCGALLLAAVVVYYWPVVKSVICPIHQLSPILVKGMTPGQGKDSNVNYSSYYINQTEVTVGEYRKYCESTNQKLPPQPWPVLNSNPVVNVSWLDATAFCKARGGRLPTETEWEYAASANLQTRYAGGNNARKVAVYNRKRLSPVATRDPNAFALYDMSGNVAEWTSTFVDRADSLVILKGGDYSRGIYSLQLTARDTQQINASNKYTGFRIAWDHKP